VLPSGVSSVVEAVETLDGPLEEAFPPQSVTVRLADDVDVSRGDVLVKAEDHVAGVPLVREFEADVCWFADRPLRPGARYLLKHLTHTAEAIVDEILDVVDVRTLERGDAPAELGLNDIGRIRLRTRRPLLADPYARNRVTGAFILIDESNNDTVAGGMIA
jgi:sulfate adenylyltransferase subunit 1 (EFTu-like GTPase family)